MPRSPLFLILFNVLLALLMCGCTPQVNTVTVTRAAAVPYPARPDFVQLENGDVACMTYAARQRLGQRHTLIVWYLRELENALKTYDAQTDTESR